MWINTVSGGAFVWTGAKWQGSFVSGEENKHDVDRARDWAVYVGVIRVGTIGIILLGVIAALLWYLAR